MAAIEKILTDNPYLDELIYYIKMLAMNCILKNEQEALNGETQQSRTDSGIYIACMDGTANVYTLDFSQEVLEAAGLDATSITDILANKYVLLDESKFTPIQRQHIINVAATDFINKYEEYNNYYRMLNGKPNVGDIGVKVTDWTPPAGVIIDLNKYVHNMTVNELEVLNQYDIIDKLIETYPNDKYLRHLPPKAIGYYNARKSGNFEVLYLPTIESVEIYDRFKEKLDTNRQYVLQTMYSEAYKFESTYYDSMMMILIVVQSMLDSISEIQEMIANKEVLDLRCIQYIFESYGVPFYSEIPIKFQKRLVKNLNSLLKYKSTSKNMLDILELFGFSNVEAYKYYLLKNRKMDENGHFVFYTKNGTEELGYTTNWYSNQQLMLTNRKAHAGIGDSGAAVLVVKGDKGYVLGSPAPVYADILYTTEKFDGDNWVVGPDTNQRGTYIAGIGTVLNASIVGGHSYVNDLYADNFMELFDSTTWTTSEATLTTSRFQHTMCGIVNSAIVVGGISSTGTIEATTELYNGTIWSAGGNLNTARSECAVVGVSTNAIITGGNVEGNVKVNTTEIYNGSAWSVSNNLLVNRYAHAAIGESDDALVTGGSSNGTITLNSTELYNGTTWVADTYMTSDRKHHSTSGSTTNAMSAGGSNTAELNTCETRLKQMSYNQIEDINRNFELMFVKVPINNDNPDDYLKDSASYYNYDDITSGDPTWDGGLPHSIVKQKLLEETFNYARTKYISIDTSYNVTQLAFQTPYFFNMIFDDVLIEENLYINIPTLSDSKNFKLTDTIAFLMGLAYEHNHGTPGAFIEPEEGKHILAFNFETDMTEVESVVNNFGFTMEEVGLRVNGVSQFVIPDSSIVNFDKLMEVFDQNGKIFAMIVTRMLHASNITEYRVYDYLYNELMTIPHTNNYFRDEDGVLYSNFMTFIQNRDSVLYGYLFEVHNINDASTKIQTITNLISACITALEEFIDGDKYKYVYSMVPGSSAGSVKSYVYKIINFFKSYKVDFMGLSNIYKFDDKMDATIKMIDGITINPTFIKTDVSNVEDGIKTMSATSSKSDTVEVNEYIYITRTYETAE